MSKKEYKNLKDLDDNQYVVLKRKDFDSLKRMAEDNKSKIDEL